MALLGRFRLVGAYRKTVAFATKITAFAGAFSAKRTG
jgi:hypothetical protein